MNKNNKKILIILGAVLGAIIIGTGTYFALQAFTNPQQAEPEVKQQGPTKAEQARSEIEKATENYNSDPKQAMEHYQAAKKLFEEANDKEGIDEINRRIAALERDINFKPPKNLEYKEDEPYHVEFDASKL